LILSELLPDFLLVYGDRFESFAALIASTQMNVPTAHVEAVTTPRVAHWTTPSAMP